MNAEPASQPPLGPEGAALLADLGIAPAQLRPIGAGGPPSSRLVPLASAPLDLAAWSAELGARDCLLAMLDGRPDSSMLAEWRNRLWPLVHVIAIYESGAEGLRRRTLSGKQTLATTPAPERTFLAARRREHVLSPEATIEKFDQNAPSWNGLPGSPGYAHFRWMRRYVAERADARSARRILDFGCGAGWVGIEAALRAPGAELCAFDPSPEMVRIAEANARTSGLRAFQGRVGFGEEPPFPAAGEPPFDLVYSSGVISFSPDPERWLDGLARTVAPGGVLVVGDIHGASSGMLRRKREKPLLPVRELNAQTREAVRSGLERRGFRFETWSAYQFSWPLPQLMHWNETRLGGLMTQPLLLANRGASACDRLLGSPAQALFDSWVQRLRRL